MQTIPFEKLILRPHFLWNNQWLVLASGDFKAGHFNFMTVGWGSLGTMWSLPFAQVVVRPTRYTYEFMEKYETFTLCAFAREYRKKLSLIGSTSGRQTDKVKASGLTPCEAKVVAAPVFAEAELQIECRKIYFSDLEPAHFLKGGIADNYKENDYHRIYFGEIVAITGAEKYLAAD
ncbi:MAG: flavin reductase [Candidatus Marinimicrobia bacterium]|nr:flavin reductase [Candidatus Neomarinimicrobiota bacterium]MDD5540295.1 flavin reductase [Candidatus Neomarinimicrobiota bacterium]